jgi:hypothetical protein
MVTRTQKEKAYSEAMKLIAEAIDDRSQELVLAYLKIQSIPKLEKPSSVIKKLYVNECPALTPLSHNSCRLHRTTPTPSTQGR